jgi:hypothetical protein
VHYNPDSSKRKIIILVIMFKESIKYPNKNFSIKNIILQELLKKNDPVEPFK